MIKLNGCQNVASKNYPELGLPPLFWVTKTKTKFENLESTLKNECFENVFKNYSKIKNSDF
jgi:hypothetical protein